MNTRTTETTTGQTIRKPQQPRERWDIQVKQTKEVGQVHKKVKVYFRLKEATGKTSYAASIKPFQQAKNGRGAWLALMLQYTGDDKWETEIKAGE